MQLPVVFLFVIATVFLVLIATRSPRVSVQTIAYGRPSAPTAIASIPLASVAPASGESGFGFGGGVTASVLAAKPQMSACSSLYRKPASAEKAAPSLDGYFSPATATVPTEYTMGAIGGCPPVKPLSSSTPLANIPMCAALGQVAQPI
jgi:hypothetical protein